MRCQGTGHIPLRLNGRGASVERFSQDTLLHALKNKNPILFFFCFLLVESYGLVRGYILVQYIRTLVSNVSRDSFL